MEPETEMSLTAREIEQRLTEFVEHQLVSTGVRVGREDDLLSGEILDSMSLMRLATFVAEEFELEIQPADFVIENFQNVAALTGYVERACGQND